ncbi:malto-oligosyltrehalose trehalohydrolase [Mycetocola zhujimingii]|uniref:Malto-oligosyltrehalose trehalohydrolase n=1 Tax=Mycetocola zhujimingii TaxID=2079792 RepID=A0A2U1TFZ2_9MICO|nr:malto-oligosyltrehalose trehalohydrolase [Mycetocola zhujimingii]PWC07809.1 malto-oligosyltrehalose trehalohydrolase [Mycetocola zhujimingii]
MIRRHREPFTVWAPNAERVELVLGDSSAEMTRGTDGWWVPASDVVASDSDYGYRIDGAGPFPDPRSRRQPNGVHELSRTFDPTEYRWNDSAWSGRQLGGAVIYEMHIGTFTPEGTFDSALAKLDHLVDLGIDFVEVLPVNAFNGTHNWGYDGVLWYAVSESYGGPAGYQRFVDACHAAGLGVIQDVVYNHLGPSGNYLPNFGPYLTDGPGNTWGSSINLDGEHSDTVREYILENVLMWLDDYHVDGLRLDAVHALVDSRATHLLEEMATRVAALSAAVRRPLSLIAESDLNDPTLITPREANGYGLDGQWSDDFHHAVHVALTRETTGYYADFEPLSALAKVLTRGFFHDGTFSSFRGRTHGRAIDTQRMPSWRLVVANQNHDQIGNRATGDRLGATLDPGQLAIAATLTLASGFTPMLFMGEEWGAKTPWQFFTSHPEPELGKATAEGRIAEFERMGWDPNVVPDPQELSTFENSKLDWNELESVDSARLLDWYKELTALRRARPDLVDPRFGATGVEVDEDERWLVLRRGSVAVVINFDEEEHTIPARVGGELLSFASDGDAVRGRHDSAITLAPHAVLIAEFLA